MPYVPTPVPTGMDDTLSAYLDDQLLEISDQINLIFNALYPAYGGMRVSGPKPMTLPAGQWVVIPADLQEPSINTTFDPADHSLTLERGGVWLWGATVVFESTSAMDISLGFFVDGVIAGRVQETQIPVNLRIHSFSMAALDEFPIGSKIQIVMQTVANESIIVDNFRFFAQRQVSSDAGS